MQNKELIAKQLFEKYLEYKNDEVNTQQFWNHISNKENKSSNLFSGDNHQNNYYVEALLHPLQNRISYDERDQRYIWNAGQNFLDFIIDMGEFTLLNSLHFDLFQGTLATDILNFVHSRIANSINICTKGEKIIIDKILRNKDYSEYQSSKMQEHLQILEQASEQYEKSKNTMHVVSDTINILLDYIPPLYANQKPGTENSTNEATDIKLPENFEHSEEEQNNAYDNESESSDVSITFVEHINPVEPKTVELDLIKLQSIEIQPQAEHNNKKAHNVDIGEDENKLIDLTKQLAESEKCISIYQKDVAQLEKSLEKAEDSLYQAKIQWFMYGILFGVTVACALFALWKSLQITSVSVYQLVREPEPRFVIAHSQNAVNMIENMLDVSLQTPRKVVC